jgi:L-threonylcarbamoyladenylate synthase
LFFSIALIIVIAATSASKMGMRDCTPSNIPVLLTGGMKTIAIRLTDNPLIADLCNSTNSALVSTSANVSGFPVAQTSLKLRVYFNDQLDFIISPNAQKNAPSHIVNLETGEEIR